MVTSPLTSEVQMRAPGSTCATVVSSDRLPSSISCMIMVAVHTFVMDPTWNSESGVVSTPVPLFSTP